MKSANQGAAANRPQALRATMTENLNSYIASDMHCPAVAELESLGDTTHTAMTTLTKDQIRKLPSEQQEALASAEVGCIRSDQQLLKRACRDMSAWAGLWMGLACGLAILSTAVPRALPFSIIAVASLITYHATRIYRRLDAMMELFEQDSHGVPKREESELAPRL